MQLSISNVIINYFLLHEDVTIIKENDLIKLAKEIEKKFDVKIDMSKDEVCLTVDLCEDFLKLEEGNIIQKDIINHVEELEPVYEWFSFGKWNRSKEYYDFLKEFIF